jgi:hypothetical protein
LRSLCYCLHFQFVTANFWGAINTVQRAAWTSQLELWCDMKKKFNISKAVRHRKSVLGIKRVINLFLTLVSETFFLLRKLR